MERTYSGLRRKRKRAHSTKCPCCYSSEDEPENHTDLQKEKIKEGNQITGQRTRGKKSVHTSEEENENREVSNCHPVEVTEAKKSGSAGAKKKTARGTKDVFGSKKRKAAKLKQENTDTQQKDQKRQTTRQSTTCTKKTLKTKSKTTKVEQAGQLNEDLEQRKALDVNKSKDTLEKCTKSRVKSKMPVGKKRTTREENSASGLEKKDLEVKGKICSKQNSLGSKSWISSENGITTRLNQNPSGENSSKANKKKVKSTQLTDSESGSPRKQNSVKANTISKSGKLQSTETLSKKKVEVFDHLFAELKKCPGQSKASISMATELFLNFTSEKLKYLIQVPISKTGKEDNHDLRQSVNTKTQSKGKHVVSAAGLSSAEATDINDNCVLSPRNRGFRKSEETKLSQAAEALVSFRTNPSVLRQEKPEVDMQNTGVVKESIAENSVAKNIENSLGSVQNVMCSTSQDVEALMQVVSTGCEARLSQRNFSLSSPVVQNNLASKVSRSSLFQSLTSSGNVQQVTTCQPNVFTFGQLTSQMGAASTVESHMQPEVITPSSVSESSAVMSTGFIRNPTDVQNLQGLFCTTPQPSNFQIQSTLPSPVTAHPAGQSTQPRPILSQPLKGMEDVVSCVGSHSAALLWNVKPAAPVVYITSPQTLSGVRARNIVPNEGQGVLPFGANPAKLSSFVPNTSVNLQGADLSTLGKVNKMNQQSAQDSMSHTVSAPSQRPILPREQISSFPTLPSSTLQQPVTQGTSQIPGNSQPLGTGSVSLQSGILSVVSPLNRQPPTTYSTQMVTLNTTHNAVSNTVTVTPVSAKQAVKRFVHQRTKSAELKRTGSVGNIPSTDTVDVPVTSSEKVVNLMCRLPVQNWTRQALNLNEQSGGSETSEFNLQQAASALLSISSQDGLDTLEVLQPGGDGDDSLDEPDDEVVFTSKGVFRVGDVDVDPKYNRIGREGYSCGKCGKIFTSLSYLARHIKRVCPDMSCRKWKCTMCDKAFRHPFGLQQHIYTHTGERPHKCSQCPKAFYSSNDLRRHSRIHSGERPYHCKHCEKSFATTISLKTHTYIHTGEKPHKCPHCPKTFATSSKLGRHIVTHSEERPFSCKQCPKSFNRSGDLRRHNMHVHETRDKSFGWDDSNGPLGTLDCMNVDMNNHDDRSDNLERDKEPSLQSLLRGETCELSHDCVVVSSHGKFNQSG